MTKKGFTLIELLVVVLIIGILAAIALPQYFKAVEKARASEALSLMGTIAAAAERARLVSSTNTYPSDMSVFDIEIPGFLPPTTIDTKNFTIEYYPGSSYSNGRVIAVRGGDMSGGYKIQKSFYTGETICQDQTASGSSTAGVCASLGLKVGTITLGN